MSLFTLTADSLTQTLGEVVEDVMVIIGKHEVQGFDSKTISELLGVSQEDVEAVQSQELYKNVLLLMKVENSKGRIQTDNMWDAIEEVGLERLFERVKLERDGDFLLKVVAVANKAQRRTSQSKVLDPSQAGVRIPLTLTRRTVERFASDGTGERATEETMRINDGRMTQPSFADVDTLLSVSQKPFLDKAIEIKTVHADPSADDLMQDIESENW